MSRQGSEFGAISTIKYARAALLLKLAASTMATKEGDQFVFVLCFGGEASVVFDIGPTLR